VQRADCLTLPNGREGATRQQLHDIFAGCGAITLEMAVKFEKARGLLTPGMQMNYDLAQIRARTASFKVKRLALA
jgi:plasmid maintenance system antidote protein VapI